MTEPDAGPPSRRPALADGSPLPEAPATPFDAAGALAFGTYVGRMGQLDWSPAASGAGWQWRRWKRWHYVSVTGPELFLAVAVVDLGWASSAFAYLVDRTSGRLLADVDTVGPGRAATVAPSPGSQSPTTFRSRRLFVRLHGGDGGRWRLEARSPMLTVDATLLETPAGPTLCALAPVPGGVADCTHKTPALSVDGVAGSGGRTFELGGCVAALDHTSGLLARRTRWRWASASDATTAVNLTEDFTAPYENALWTDGAVRRLPAVHFQFDPTRPDDPWLIRSDDGSVDLTFVPEGRRAKRTNLVVAASSYLQPVGTFSGLAGGLRVNGLAGVTEDHMAKW